MAINAYHPRNSLVYFGLSTDTKPIAPIGSKFIETDTDKVYIYNNVATWMLVGTFSGSSSNGIAATV